MTILRPTIQILDPQHKEQIFEEAKSILAHQGVFLENKQAEAIFQDSGIDHKDQRYFIPEDIIKNSIDSAPKEISLYDREAKNKLSLSENNVYFDPGSAAIFYLDENTGQIREPLHQDFVRFTKIVEQLPYIEAQSTALVYSDVPKHAQDWHRLYTCLKYSNKPIITGTFRKESFEIMKELLLTFRSSPVELEKKPLAIFDACPSPPLGFSDLTSQSVIDAAHAMIPSEIISMPMAGANAPITLLGSITQHCAETITGLVLAQLVKKGSPVIWGGSPAIMDMKHGTTPMGAIETMMIDLGDVEMGKYLGFPTHAYMGLSDAKIPDIQSGIESGIGAILAGLSGINMVSGPGMLDFESVQSIEKLLIDNETAGMVKRLVSGIEDYGSPYAEDILKDYDKEKELLSHPSTLKYFRKELFFPSAILTRSTREEWKASGSSSARRRAKDRIPELLAKSQKFPIPKSQETELDKIATEYL